MFGLVKLEGLEEIESCCLTNHRLLNFLAISSHQGRVREGVVQVFRTSIFVYARDLYSPIYNILSPVTQCIFNRLL